MEWDPGQVELGLDHSTLHFGRYMSSGRRRMAIARFGSQIHATCRLAGQMWYVLSITDEFVSQRLFSRKTASIAYTGVFVQSFVVSVHLHHSGSII